MRVNTVTARRYLLEPVRILDLSRSSRRKEAHSSGENRKAAKEFEPPYVGCYDFSDTLLWNR
jgi:hypothetical protein